MQKTVLCGSGKTRFPKPPDGKLPRFRPGNLMLISIFFCGLFKNDRFFARTGFLSAGGECRSPRAASVPSLTSVIPAYFRMGFHVLFRRLFQRRLPHGKNHMFLRFSCRPSLVFLFVYILYTHYKYNCKLLWKTFSIPTFCGIIQIEFFELPGRIPVTVPGILILFFSGGSYGFF